jgi:hypothetical protein
VVLPTLIFIFGAYLLYALFTSWPRRSSGQSRPRTPWQQLARVTLVGGLGGVLGFILWFSFSPDQQGQNLELASFLGTGWADGQLRQADRRLEYPSLNSQGPGDQPVYALLHPETPVSQVSQEKKPAAARPLRKPNLQKMPIPQGKGSKTVSQPPKKERVAAKPKVKKKKPVSSPGSPKAAAGSG